MQERRVTTGPVDWFLREAGTGPALVFGHSLTFDSEMWAPQFAALADRFRLIAVDFPGHGQTHCDAVDYSLEDMTDRLAELLAALDLDRVGYCGLSLGGMVGMRLALRHPARVAALALLSTSAEEDGNRAMLDQVNESSRGKPANEGTVQFILQLMFSAAFRAAQPAAVQPFYDKLNVTGSDGTYWAARAVIWRQSILADLDKIAAPTLVIGAEKDTAIPHVHALRISERIPGAAWQLLAGSGHMSSIEQADIVNRHLRDFFAGHLHGDKP